VQRGRTARHARVEPPPERRGSGSFGHREGGSGPEVLQRRRAATTAISMWGHPPARRTTHGRRWVRTEGGDRCDAPEVRRPCGATGKGFARGLPDMWLHQLASIVVQGSHGSWLRPSSMISLFPYDPCPHLPDGQMTRLVQPSWVTTSRSCRPVVRADQGERRYAEWLCTDPSQKLLTNPWAGSTCSWPGRRGQYAVQEHRIPPRRITEQTFVARCTRRPEGPCSSAWSRIEPPQCSGRFWTGCAACRQSLLKSSAITELPGGWRGRTDDRLMRPGLRPPELG
jgi:hypothetical protein